MGRYCGLHCLAKVFQVVVRRIVWHFYTETSREHSENSRDQAKIKSGVTSSREQLEGAGQVKVGGGKLEGSAQRSRCRGATKPLGKKVRGNKLEGADAVG